MSDQVNSLSEREVEILRLVATGAANKEIASSLVISPNTVKVHLRNIFAKIGVASRTEATLYAIEHGLVPQPGSAASFSTPPAPLPVAAEDDIYRSSPLAFSSEKEPGPEQASPPEEYLSPIAEILPAKSPGVARARRIPRWLPVTFLVLLLLFASAAAYALGRNPPAASTPAPTSAVLATVATRWMQDTHLPQALSGMGMSQYEGHYYLIGGRDGNSTLNQVYRFSPQTRTWEALASKPTSASHIRAALLGERIYVPGGQTANGKPSPILEVYDPRHNTWESKQPLPIPLSDYALAPFDGKLYLFGGFNGSAYSADVYIYSPDTDSWKKGSPLPSGRGQASADAIEGKILVCGGTDGKQTLSQVLIYYPTRDNSAETPWEEGPALPEGRYGMSSASLANMVYLFGGQSGSGQEPASLVLAADQGRWTAIDQPPGRLGGEGIALASGNFIHLFGGNPGAPSAQHLVYQAIYTIAIPITTGN